MTKPLGITLITVCAALFGFASVLLGCTATLGSQLPGFGLFLSVLGMAVLGFGALLLTAAYGLWTLQEWGRNLVYWLCVVSIPLGAISILPVWPGQRFSVGNTVLQIAGIVLNAAMVRYLSSPGVADLYRTVPPSEAAERPRREPHL